MSTTIPSTTTPAIFCLNSTLLLLQSKDMNFWWFGVVLRIRCANIFGQITFYVSFKPPEVRCVYSGLINGMLVRTFGTLF